MEYKNQVLHFQNKEWAIQDRGKKNFFTQWILNLWNFLHNRDVMTSLLTIFKIDQ